MTVNELQELIEAFRHRHELAGVIMVTFKRVEAEASAESSYQTVMTGAYAIGESDVRVLNAGAPAVLRQLADAIEKSVAPQMQELQPEPS
jgi:hypothetical protein